MQKILLLIFTLIFLVSCSEESESAKSLFNAPTNLPTDPSDTTPATVVTITNPIDATYAYNDLISFDVEFSENVVCAGSITLEIDINGNSFELPLVAGNNSSVFTFARQIDIETIDADGIDIIAINLNGDSLVDAGLNATDLDLSGQTLALNAVLVDSVRPTVNSLQINAGELYTTNTAATLNIDATNATEMLISLSSDCSTESVEAYATTKALTLSTNVLNEYYVQFKSAAGSLSDCSSAVSITHDDQAPAAAIITLAGDASDIASDSSSWTVSDNGPAGIDYYEFAISTTTDYSGVVTGGEWLMLEL
jgi:hypothetical protein